MGITSFQRARRLAAEVAGRQASETSYDDATTLYLGAQKKASEATKATHKALPDVSDDTDLRRPASIGQGDGDNNKSLQPEATADWQGLTYSAGQPGDNQKNTPENLESLKTRASVKTVDETQALLEVKKAEAAESRPEADEADEAESKSKIRRTRKES